MLFLSVHSRKQISDIYCCLLSSFSIQIWNTADRLYSTWAVRVPFSLNNYLNLLLLTLLHEDHFYVRRIFVNRMLSQILHFITWYISLRLLLILKICCCIIYFSSTEFCFSYIFHSACIVGIVFVTCFKCMCCSSASMFINQTLNVYFKHHSCKMLGCIIVMNTLNVCVGVRTCAYTLNSCKSNVNNDNN